jgi:disulfide bond formation protein DsbB
VIYFIQNHATQVISLLTLLSHVIFIGVLVIIIAHAGSRYKLYHFVHKYILKLLFWGILSAVVGSLVYSNIVGYPPCELCWIQRIFLYPQLIIVYMAMRRDDKRIIDYLIPLSVMGALVAFFHSLVQWGFSPLGSTIGCVAVGGECAKVYVDSYAYITIPFMSFTVFAYIIAMKFIYRHREKKIKNGQ